MTLSGSVCAPGYHVVLVLYRITWHCLVICGHQVTTLLVIHMMTWQFLVTCVQQATTLLVIHRMTWQCLVTCVCARLTHSWLYIGWHDNVWLHVCSRLPLLVDDMPLVTYVCQATTLLVIHRMTWECLVACVCQACATVIHVFGYICVPLLVRHRMTWQCLVTCVCARLPHGVGSHSSSPLPADVRDKCHLGNHGGGGHAAHGWGLLPWQHRAHAGSPGGFHLLHQHWRRLPCHSAHAGHVQAPR